ncbi:MAG TPA: NADH-quinone oxidoreductase subunit C [Terracidiphilus sp.]|nr:NADH-quinone oxidoreductase subunit C [Terracidiphilus sp.]
MAVDTTLIDKAAVLEAMPEHPALQALLALPHDALANHALLNHALLDARFDRGELTLTVAPERIREAAAAVQAAGFNFLEDLTAVDWLPSEPRFQVSYHILSHAMKDYIRLRVMLSGDEATLASITSVWPGANYYEREVFDLFGIRFEGHPNLRRILMPDEWVGHPLRKDYPVEGYR